MWRTAGDARLFPLLKKDGHGRWAQAWSQWWTRYRRSIGVDKRWHGMHALRHTFKRQCRECDIPKDIHDAITGHPSADVAGHYGGQYPSQATGGRDEDAAVSGVGLVGGEEGVRYAAQVEKAVAGLELTATLLHDCSIVKKGLLRLKRDAQMPSGRALV